MTSSDVTWSTFGLVILVVFAARSVAAQEAAPSTSELLARLRAMEERESKNAARIATLEGRLAEFEEGHVASSMLESRINTLLEEEAAAVTAPKSQQAAIGGQIRLRGEYRTTADYGGAVSRGADFVVQRTRLQFDFRVVDNLRTFIQLQDSRLWGEESGPLGDLQGVDVHQVYIDFENAFAQDWTFRVGRQELSYGDQRLVSPLDWHPIGRAFDGVRTWFRGDDWQLDAFVTNVVEATTSGLGPGTIERDDDHVFAGLYFAYSGIESHQLDVYAFYRSSASGSFTGENGSTGDLEDITIGGRFKGSADGFSYSAEVVGQFGDRADDDICAYAWAATANYTFDHEWKPTFGVEWTFASGDDDPTDGDFETFDPLFPFGHAYQGFLDIFSWRNGHDFVARFNVRPRQDWWFEAAVHHFRLDSDTDGWFNAGGVAMRRVGGGVSNAVGWELDVHAKHDLNAATALWMGYSHFFPGSYVEDTGASPDTDWIYFQMTVTF